MMVSSMYVGVPVPDFNETYIFSTVFRKIWNTKFNKIRPVGAELFHTDRQTDGRMDMTKLMVAFRNFTNAHL
jgi:hypothetical protein